MEQFDEIVTVDDNAWIARREDTVAAMWAAIPVTTPRVEIPEDELPF